MNGSSLNSDGQQFNQYQQNNQSPLTFNLLSEHTHKQSPLTVNLLSEHTQNNPLSPLIYSLNTHTKQYSLTFNLFSEHTHKTIPSHL